jgi:hypothetical protein
MTTLDLFDLWQTLLTEINVSQNGQIPPFVFQNWCNQINVELFRDRFGSYELIQRENDEVKLPFLKTASILLTVGAGATYAVGAYPANYEYFSSAKILRQKDNQKCNNREQLPDIDGDGKCAKYTDPDYAAMAVKFASENLITKNAQLIDDSRWESCLEHKAKGPTYDAPKINQYSGGFKVAPSGVQYLILDYLCTPRACLFAYTISADDILIYDQAGSIQLAWSNVLKADFISRLAKKYAKYIQSPEIFQMAENERKIGDEL